MKKKIPLLILGGFLVVGVARAAIVYSKDLVNATGLAHDATYVLDLKKDGTIGTTINKVAATVAYSSYPAVATSFTDGSVGTATFTVTSITGLAAVQASQTITVASTSSLKNAILYVRGAPLRQGYQWKVGASTITTAENIAAIVTKVAGIDASAANGVVYATATVAGTAGNAFTLAKVSASNLTLGGSTFSGGVDAAYVTIGGVTLTAGDEWTIGASTLTAANSIVEAIQADSITNALVTASSSSAQITLTARAVGTDGNLVLNTSPTEITRSGDALSGGTDSAYLINTSNVHKVAHGLTTALPVLYSTGGFTLSGLTNQTTYYAYRVDADNFKLSDTSTGAVAGTGFQVLTSSSVVGPHTFTLTPLAISGDFGFKWQISDDAETWVDLEVSSITFSSPYTAGSAAWDFGAVGHRYLRVDESAGTAGGWNVKVSVTGRND